MTIILDIDPATLSTAQQKGMHNGKIFTNPRVAKSMRAVRVAMSPHAPAVRSYIDHGLAENLWAGVRLQVCFWFAFPKTGTKAERAQRFDGMPVTSGRYGDLDNRHKAFQDALVQSGALPDDRFISSLRLSKRYTFGRPRIWVDVQIDHGTGQSQNDILAEHGLPPDTIIIR